MHLTYVVLLKPSEIRFTKNVIASKFDNGIPLLETFTQIKNGEILLEDIPLISVVFFPEKWEWYTLNNRRLWVFKELEKIGKCRYIKTKRIEFVENYLEYPALLYGSAALKESCRSFSWRENKLQITTHRTPSKDIEIYSDESEREYRSASRERGATGREGRVDYGETERTLKQKRRRHHCRRRRYHPYSRPESRSIKGEPSRETRVDSWYGKENVKITSWKQRYSESSEYSSLYEYRFSYTVWYRKRQDFLHRVYSRSGRLRDPSRFLEVLYTCGVCFKSFKSKVSLNQHAEELLHWACVRCGKFFGSHTALGQHKLALQHTV